MSINMIVDLLLLTSPIIVIVTSLILMKREKPKGRKKINRRETGDYERVVDYMDLYAKLRFYYEHGNEKYVRKLLLLKDKKGV